MFIVGGRSSRTSSVGAKCAAVGDLNLTSNQGQHFAPTELASFDVPSSINIPLLRGWVATSTSHSSLSSEHFHANYPANAKRGEVEFLLRTLEAARFDMLARVGPASLPAGTIDVVIHETTQAFVTATGQSWWVAGVTRGARIELQPLGVLRRRRVLNSTLRHEYAHAVIEGMGNGNTARWFTEGLAIHFAGEGPMLARFRPRTLMSRDRLEQLLARPRSAAEMRSLYAAAYAEVRRLIQKEGEPRVWRRLAARSQNAIDLPARNSPLICAAFGSQMFADLRESALV